MRRVLTWQSLQDAADRRRSRGISDELVASVVARRTRERTPEKRALLDEVVKRRRERAVLREQT